MADTNGEGGGAVDVRFLPAGGRWRHPVAAVRVEDDPRGVWRCTNGAWLTDAEIEQHGQRLVPAPALHATCELLGYLLRQYDGVVAVHETIVMDTKEDRDLHRRSVEAFQQAAEPVRAWIDELNAALGEASQEVTR